MQEPALASSRSILVRRHFLAFGILACHGLVLLTGCSDSDRIKEQWESRDALPSCGSLELRLAESLEADGKKEVACLKRALDSGGSAELRVRFIGTEGDPVVEYYRVIAGGTTEVYTDSTQDINSDQNWGYANCAQPESALDVAC